MGALGGQGAWRWNASQERREADEVVAPPEREDQRDGLAARIRQRVNLGRPSAARSADRFGDRLPFAPAVERRALTRALSADAAPITPLEPVSAWKTSS